MNKILVFLILTCFLNINIYSQTDSSKNKTLLLRSPRNIIKTYPSGIIAGYFSFGYELRLTKKYCLDFGYTKFYYDDMGDNLGNSLDDISMFINSNSWSYQMGLKIIIDSIKNYRNCLYLEPLIMYKEGVLHDRKYESYDYYNDKVLLQSNDYGKKVYAAEIMLGYQYINKYNMFFACYAGVGGRYKELYYKLNWYETTDEVTNKIKTVISGENYKEYKLNPSFHLGFIFGYSF